jgi:SOS response regulatory protein OraA/RecX
LGDVDEEARCAKIARRKSISPPQDVKEKQKLIAYLIRQGYDMTTIRHALDIAWEDE